MAYAGTTANYVNRPVMDAVTANDGVPVVLLEGPRAVGKTTAVRERLLPEYTIVTFEDPSELALAQADLDGWLSRQRLPLVIDEAQRAPGIALAVKRLVDRLGPTARVVLTGSVSLQLEDLSGANPLAGRSVRFTMRPITAWEIARQPGSLTDALFEGVPVLGVRPTVEDRALADQLARGGFPLVRLARPAVRSEDLPQRIDSEIDSRLLNPGIKDFDYNATHARAALDLLLRTPGAIFNASRLSQQLQIDRRTVDRYLDLFHRLFLVYTLPNLATSPSRQTYARAKVHPMDTAFSYGSLARAGVDLPAQRTEFGQLIESYVVGQITASIEWSRTRPDAFYWRESGTGHEVDLVLRDAQSRLVGVEVKAAVSISESDLRGLRRLRATRGLHRGYVFYGGTEVRQLDADIWALPYETLESAEPFDGPWPGGPQDPAQPEPWGNHVTVRGGTRMAAEKSGGNDAAVFLSYVHQDDARAGGRIVQLAKDIVGTYEYLFGATLELFVDRDDIRWGENWRDRLGSELDGTSFLMSAVTPRYLQSEACREEVLTFARVAKTVGDQRLLLPILWIDPASADVVPDGDPVLTQLMAAQYVQAEELRSGRVQGHEYEEFLEATARRLRETIKARESAKAVGERDQSSEHDGADLVELMASFSDGAQAFQDASARLFVGLSGLERAFNDAEPPRDDSPQALATALERMGSLARGPADELDVAATQLSDAWLQIEDAALGVVDLLAAFGDDSQTSELRATLDDLVSQLDLPGVEPMRAQLQAVGSMSRHLRPVSRSVDAVLRVVTSIRSSAVEMSNRLDAAAS